MSIVAWRHPKPEAVAGRCIGRTDVRIDRRKAKRLAHRIRAWARRHGAPREVITSPLRRSAEVGRWLARWGWRHRIDARLTELDFGEWDGRVWAAIAIAAVDAWCADFANHAPGGGETVMALLQRCRSFIDDHRLDAPVCIVTHAGWLSASNWLAQHTEMPSAAEWPKAVGYGAEVRVGSPR